MENKLFYDFHVKKIKRSRAEGKYIYRLNVVPVKLKSFSLFVERGKGDKTFRKMLADILFYLN